MPQTPFLLALAALVLVLGGCAAATPSFGPSSPRNGAGQPMDPIYGTPIPGYPLVNGRGS